MLKAHRRRSGNVGHDISRMLRSRSGRMIRPRRARR
jgi:hypothetical protein